MKEQLSIPVKQTQSMQTYKTVNSTK